VKVRRTRDKNEAMGRKDGRCVLVVGRREIASERDANVRIETRTPHKNKIFS
jgi:hypothetical protein